MVLNIIIALVNALIAYANYTTGNYILFGISSFCVGFSTAFSIVMYALQKKGY